MARDIAAERRDIERAIEGKTLCSVFADTAARLGDRPALVAGGTTRTWQQYRDEVRAVALGLRELGFSPGQFALLLARNRPEHVIADLGIVHAGGTPVSAYTTSSPDQLAYIAGHCEARVAFVEDTAFLAKLPALPNVVLLTGSAPGVTTYAQLLELGRAAHARDPQAFDRTWRAVQPDDILTLVYTSGTTGHPKGVIDTHRSSLWCLTSARRVIATTPDDSIISYLPLAHAADRFLSYYASIVSGHTTHFCPDVTQILATLVQVRPTFFGAVPRIWEKLHAGISGAIANEPDEQRKRLVMGALEVARAVVAHEQRGEPVPAELRARRQAVEPVLAAVRAKVGLDRARVTVTGAAPTPVEVIEFFHALGVAISEVWGMSELAVISSINPLERIKIGSIGTMIDGVEAKIAADGELLVRGGHVMRGYYKDPDRTAETIDRDGWLATGDVAAVDGDGYYRIVDRKKELIITAGGKNISPANLESQLKFHPLISQACVIGDNRPYLTALIVLDPLAAKGLSGDEQAAQVARAVAEVNERVSRVENIRKWTILPGEWTAESEELTPTLKLKRRVIATKHAPVIEEMYR